MDSFKTRSELRVGTQTFTYYSLEKLEKATGKPVRTLPFSLRVLLENLLRLEDGSTVRKSDIEAIVNWDPKSEPDQEIQFMPARVLLQDFTGVPAVADLAAMRDAVAEAGGDPKKINPLQPVDLVVDHSVQVDHFGHQGAMQRNAEIEFNRNRERYEFLKWGQNAFQNFRVVPPDTGIVHQVNLEYLAQVAFVNQQNVIYPDTLVGTDSHTTMINGLGVLGWGVGGIEAEAAMLGQPICMLIPQVIGFRLTGKLNAGATATDLVLTVTEMLRKKGVVGKFVEFFGPGARDLTLADRATIANMAPEYGATCGIFGVDERTCDYLVLTGREDLAPRVEAYMKAQNLWGTASETALRFTDLLELDLSSVEPCLAGPSRPQDRVPLSQIAENFSSSLPGLFQKKTKEELTGTPAKLRDFSGLDFTLDHGSVVIAAITSCTNTSNPAGLITAGLVAKKAVEKGITTKPWVKTSLAPGSKVVTDYLSEAGLLPYLEALRFHVVGYGCTTCIGNSGPLSESITKAIVDHNLAVCSVLSGNRNFEGRVHANVRANYLASPALVVAYALAGSTTMNISKDPVGFNSVGDPVFLKDIWPSPAEIQAIVTKHVNSAQFKKSYADVFSGDSNWQNLKVPTGDRYKWDSKSTYIKQPPFFQTKQKTSVLSKAKIENARCLAYLGDSITTDHISPAGNIAKNSPAATYLNGLGVENKDFNGYGARRGNHEVMMRGTFANVRLKNKLVPGSEGNVTVHFPTSKQMSIFDASQEYIANGTPLMILAGKEYGTGSSRDWGAKGPKLQGIQFVIAESFERIHRSNLVGMGILPLQFLPGESAMSHGFQGDETFEVTGLEQLAPGKELTVTAKATNGSTKSIQVKARIDTPNELEYMKQGGILQFVLSQLASSKG